MPSAPGESPRESTPLLPPGFHRMSMVELRTRCADAFPDSVTRRPMVMRLEQVVEALRKGGIMGELWIGGSVMTQKVNPQDLDVLLRVSSEIADHGSIRQKRVIEWVHETDLCDGYRLIEYPQGHPLYLDGAAAYEYWRGQFGRGRSGNDQGIAVIILGHGGHE